MSERYDIPFICDPARAFPKQASFEIRSMPLGDALDKLTDTYPDTEWEYRKLGFIVVRGPRNPARDPRQGQAAQTVIRP